MMRVLTTDTPILMSSRRRPNSSIVVSNTIYYRMSWNEVYRSHNTHDETRKSLDIIGPSTEKHHHWNESSICSISLSTRHDHPDPLNVLDNNLCYVKKRWRKKRDFVDAIANISYFDTAFWYSKFVKSYERNGLIGVCRVARAFRTLYGVE